MGYNAIAKPMTEARRFPPPWTIEENPESFVVKEAIGQAIG
jgi:hypothetical protein